MEANYAMKNTSDHDQGNHADKNLVGDERGAIMVMGLAMILGLIAFMWYLLGIGETVAFRDHMQDAADGGAFSQSAVNALGMNFIVFCNMIIMVLVVIYLVLSVIVTAQYFQAWEECAESDIFFEIVCPIVFFEYYEDWKNRNSRAKNIADYGDKPLSYIESGVALLAPLAGSVAAYDDIKDFKTSMMDATPKGFSFGGTNIPSSFDAFKLTPASENDPEADGGVKKGPRYGLPVTHEHLAYDCQHIFDGAADLVAGFIPSGAGKFLGMIGGALGYMAQFYYCSDEVLPPGIIPGGKVMGALKKIIPADAERALIGGGDGADYWYKDGYGPMENWNHVGVSGAKDSVTNFKDRHKPEEKNGADVWQTYGFVVMPKDNDHHATHNIKFMQLGNSGWSAGETTQGNSYGYFANAELYFDCEKDWSDKGGACASLGTTDRMDMTMYRFEWRARLVKFHAPTKLGGELFNVVQNALDMFSSVRALVNGAGGDMFTQIIGEADSLLGTDIMGGLGKIADAVPVEIYH
jgi:hypothetical protein